MWRPASEYAQPWMPLPGLPAVTKSDLIAELAASYPHLRQADAELIVSLVFDQITDVLAGGDRVELRGFGVFTVKRSKPRIGRNPRTGEEVPVSERAKPVFRTGNLLHARLNHGGTKRHS